MKRVDYTLVHQAKSGEARAGLLKTRRGVFETPMFMPVGTQATVRHCNFELLKKTGSQILLANTYHLLLRPGPEVFRRMGGIHRFMHWDKAVLTDSGGFQVFSLPHSRTMTEDGAVFRSYVDGMLITLSPETSIGMQASIDSDIMMAMDQCIPSTAAWDEAKTAMELTHRWARRSLDARGDSAQALFGIVQGACFEDLRAQSVEVLGELPFDGLAIGGLAVGESRNQRDDFAHFCASRMPRDLPRYLMGVGTPRDLLQAVHAGVDMFDCILPVSLAQHGLAFTSRGKVHLRRSVYEFSDDKLDPACRCDTCAFYSKAYLHHLIKTEEALGTQLVAQHNLTYYHDLMATMRAHILNDTFARFHADAQKWIDEDDPEFPKHAMKRKIKAREKTLRAGSCAMVPVAQGFEIRHTPSDSVLFESWNPPETDESHIAAALALLNERGGDADAKRVVIWEIGKGTQLDGLAALRHFEKRSHAGVKIVSFLDNTDCLGLAVKGASRVRLFQHRVFNQLLEHRSFLQNNVEWKLEVGAEPGATHELPDAIFFDPPPAETGWKYSGEDFARRLHERFGSVIVAPKYRR